MKFLLAAVNAKYIHSNPAVYSLRAYAREHLSCSGADIEIGEYTINHRNDDILQDIYEKKPDFIGFSCYIWNIGQVMELVRDLRQILPDTVIWLGGPEVSFDAEKILAEETAVQGIMRGEGERTFYLLTEAFLEAGQGTEAEGGNGSAAGNGEKTDQGENAENSGKKKLCSGRRLEEKLEEIPGISWRSHTGEIRKNPAAPLLSMDEIPFYYEDVAEFENRIIYYESSRGCPFSCSYCLSSVDKSVRFRSLDKVKKELDFFLEKRVPQVKFVDRTFNCRKEHTMGIWRYLLEHDNGITNFHFEISADLLDGDELELIKKMRPGLIQLEIGVQSTNLRTVSEIRRTMNLERLKDSVDQVRKFRNIHQHLDLIAGLPFENCERFLESYDDVYRMRPDQLQLGFLKVLKGSYMADRTEEYELKYRHTPPYEVLSTRWLNYGDVIRLKQLEEMTEVYYNSGQFACTLEMLQKEFARPSELFLRLADYYKEENLTGRSFGRLARYEILYDFICRAVCGAETGAGREMSGNQGTAEQKNRSADRLSAYRDRLMTDLFLRENLKSRPSFASDQSPYKEAVREFFRREERERVWLPGYAAFDSRQLASMAHLEILEDGTWVLFDYKERDPLSRNARMRVIPREWHGEDEKH